MRGTLFDAFDCDLQREAGPACVRDQEVAAATQGEERKIEGAREGHGLLNVCNSFCFGEIPCRTADSQGGQGSERNVFEDLHEPFSSYTPEREGAQSRAYAGRC